MIEIPESYTISKQLNQSIRGKTISYVKANQSPHSFAWYFGNPEDYDNLLSGKTVGMTYPRAGMVDIKVEDCRILLCDGVAIRYFEDLREAPKKHQLYIEFDDRSAIVCTVQMYGGLWAFHDGENNNPYYLGAMEKPSPLNDEFNYEYFSLLRTDKTGKLSSKAFLATEQRIPGLGNGVLQDILFKAGIHPKRKMTNVPETEFRKLFNSIKVVLKQMSDQGGRDIEKDIFGNKGGYQTLLSKKTVLTPCTQCGYELRKENYLGGTIYYCENCQK